jgi:hypothetical protein
MKGYPGGARGSTGSVLARWWIGLAALYLLLAWSLAPAELVVAAVAATVGTTGAALVGARLRVPLRSAWRQLLGLFTDLVPLARALPARRGGRLERVPPDDPALSSLAPASIVVRVEDDEMVVHRL